MSTSLSHYELGRRFWHQQDYQRSLDAVEQAIALKLFAYDDEATQELWQKHLILPGFMLKRPKLELADALILMANSMYELGRRQNSIEHLYISSEVIYLASALMHSGLDLVKEVLLHLEELAKHVAVAAMDVLNQMHDSSLIEIMNNHRLDCTGDPGHAPPPLVLPDVPVFYPRDCLGRRLATLTPASFPSAFNPSPLTFTLTHVS